MKEKHVMVTAQKPRIKSRHWLVLLGLSALSPIWWGVKKAIFVFLELGNQMWGPTQGYVDASHLETDVLWRPLVTTWSYLMSGHIVLACLDFLVWPLLILSMWGWLVCLIVWAVALFYIVRRYRW